ncbi:hypothetical protein F8388_005375 [Cannabis sativa]|uniref:Reverse transcriptase zinc-binding domain-containing protein n=1 Tax=Cannabis sativa TaxID=3483 RepID=A0A7J6E4A7_CANSA|nr:hypothetical protein F8388_005375 [Cannabis sativa]
MLNHLPFRETIENLLKSLRERSSLTLGHPSGEPFDNLSKSLRERSSLTLGHLSQEPFKNLSTTRRESIVDADLGDNSSSSITDHWWTTFWKPSLPSKVWIFMRRIFHMALPVAAELHRRHIAIDPICPLCRIHPETITHALFFYNKAKEVWRLSSLMLASHYVKIFCCISQSTFLQHNSKSLLFFAGVSSLKEMSNTMDKLLKKPVVVIMFASSYLVDYKSTRAIIQHHESRTITGAAELGVPLGRHPKPKWLALPTGTLKLNTDATFDESKNNCVAWFKNIPFNSGKAYGQKSIYCLEYNDDDDDDMITPYEVTV